MDIVLALLPWKIIWTVAINKREKLGALLAMSAGIMYVSKRPISLQGATDLAHHTALESWRS
jgi:hypothetical protein